MSPDAQTQIIEEPPVSAPSLPPELGELLQKRVTIEEWLARLEAQRDTASERVVERVRADYEHRLRETLDALAQHRGALREALERARDAFATAGEDHALATDQLEEARLRNAIGELEDDKWAAQRALLGETISDAEGRQETARAEGDRLAQLLTQLAEPELEPDALIQAEAIAALESATLEEGVPSGMEGGTPSEGSDQQDFLSEIDRALAGVEEPRAVEDDTVIQEPPLTFDDSAPRPGLKCAECGYTNDISAWFCGVCGADVG